MNYRSFIVHGPYTKRHPFKHWAGVATLRGTNNVEATSQTDLYDQIDAQMNAHLARHPEGFL